MSQPNPHQRIKAHVGSRVIGYLPLLAIHFGSVNAGLLLSQILFWSDKGWKKGWVYKTVKDMYWETGLTRYQQETAIKVLEKHGVLEVKLMSIPATRHFRVNLEKLEELIGSSLDFPQLERQEVEDKIEEKQQTITEITPESTAKNTLRIRKKNYDAKGVESLGDILKSFGEHYQTRRPPDD